MGDPHRRQLSGVISNFGSLKCCRPNFVASSAARTAVNQFRFWWALTNAALWPGVFGLMPYLYASSPVKRMA